ncbi:MAG: S41 family peptidase [Alphaproteobacteria bacterium]
MPRRLAARVSGGTRKTVRKGGRRRPQALAAPFLADLDDAVKPHLKGAVTLPKFLARAESLSLAERRRIVDQAILLLEEFYVHLPMKRAMHGIDPARQLRLLRLRLRHLPSDLAFHHEMLEVFLSLRDLHTNYLLPHPYNKAVAFLPFEVEHCVERGNSKYIVTKLLPGFRHAHFRVGVEVVSWNWIPIERAVMLVGGINAASNEAARHARGVKRLTIRPMMRALPPEEHVVSVAYSSHGGRLRRLELPWLVFAPRHEALRVDHDAVTSTAMSLGIDIEADAMRHGKTILYKPHVVAAEARLARGRRTAGALKGSESTMPAVFEAGAVRASGGPFGYIRVRTFHVDDGDAFVAEFVRLLALVPQRGLILDVRDNGGGVLSNGEMILQLLTPREIEPEPLQMRTTRHCLELCRLDPADRLGPWLPSMERASETGSAFSAGISLDERAACNAIGQRYYGPVVLVTSGLCYSTTDIFAAGFRDHEVGTILGTDDNTGAGGANVWTYGLLQQVFAHRGRRRQRFGLSFRALPKEAGLRVALRRMLRVGRHAGVEVEEFGIVPDEVHRMTRGDLLQRNRDLLRHAARILAKKPAYVLNAKVIERSREAIVAVASEGIERLDVFLDGRPVSSEAVRPHGGAARIVVPARAGGVLELRGFRRKGLVVRRKMKI